MKAKEIRKWLDDWTNPEEEIWVNEGTLVHEGSGDPWYTLEVGLQPEYDKEWRIPDACERCGHHYGQHGNDNEGSGCSVWIEAFMCDCAGYQQKEAR